MRASPVWESAIHRSNAWLNELAGELGWDVNGSLLALRCVLHALRDRLPPNEAVDLAAQLPLIIKGVYFDGWNPSATPVRARSKEEFLALVRKPLERGAPGADAERVTRAVFKLIASHVSEGELRDVRGVMPGELVELWPEHVRAGFHRSRH